MTKSEQARADALADAETYERVAASAAWRGETGTASWWDAHGLGMAARRYMQDGNAFWAQHLTVEAAHAAFRAIPGLRSSRT